MFSSGPLSHLQETSYCKQKRCGERGRVCVCISVVEGVLPGRHWVIILNPSHAPTYRDHHHCNLSVYIHTS